MKRISYFILIILSVILLSSCGRVNAKKVDLIYSSSSKTTGQGFIDSYEDYLEQYSFLELEEAFFETHLLYTYSFTNNNTGAEIYSVSKLRIIGKTLTITLKETDRVLSPALGNYLLVFSIDKVYSQSLDQILIKGIYES